MMLALARLPRNYLRTASLLPRCLHTGTRGEDNIIRGDHVDLVNEDLYSFLSNRFKQHGDKVAIVDAVKGDQMTFNDLLGDANRLASFLDQKGYKQGDCLGIHVPNCIEYQTVLLGALANGMVFTTANPIYTPHEINHQLNNSNARVLFTNSALVDVARNAVDNSNTDLLISVDDTSINDSGVLNLSDILKDGDASFEKDLSTIDPVEDVAGLLYSSGTTGLPKGVMLTHHNISANVLQLMASCPPSVMRKNIMCVLPMFHVYGVAYVNFFHMYHGSTVVTLPSFDPVNFLTAIQQYKIEKLPIVPPIALFMINHPVVDKFDLSSIHCVTVGAAPVDGIVTKKFNDKFPGVLLTQGYGMTESLITHLQPDDVTKHKPGSAGYIAKGIEWKVRDIDTGDALGPDTKGELCSRGPQVMKGYLNNQEATAGCLGEDGWLRSGDLGYYDEEGNVFVVDRMKELIKYNAFQIAPAELEDTLLGIPGISDSCVIGIPNERAGQVPRAYVVKSPDSTIAEEEINAYFAERLSPYKQLRGGIVFVDSLPKSASGKLLRRVLLQEYLDSQS